jgi:hypothetical protein
MFFRFTGSSFIRELEISEIPFVVISKDRLGFKNRVGLPHVNGIFESSKFPRSAVPNDRSKEEEAER